MTHARRILWVAVIAAAVVALPGRAAGQNGLARTPDEFARGDRADIVGIWVRPVGSATQTLTLNADGSGSVDAVQVKWHLSGDLLIFSFSKPAGNISYHVSVVGDSLTALGGELAAPVVYRRAGASGVQTQRTDVEQAAADDGDGLPIAGKPPLTGELVQREMRCLEWVFDVQLTREQRNEYREKLVDAWKSRKQDDIDGYLNLLKLREQVEQKTPEEQDLMAVGVRTALLEKGRQEPKDQLARWIVRLYDAAHPAIAAGNPPLTAQAADAYADMLVFIINDSLHRQAINPNRQVKDLITRSVAAEYPRYSAEQQKSIAQMPFLWKELSYVWPRITEAQRNTFRQQWAPMVASVIGGAPGGGVAASNSNGNNTSMDAWFARNSEHLSLQPTFNSSFQSTMQLHLNMFH